MAPVRVSDRDFRGNAMNQVRSIIVALFLSSLCAIVTTRAEVPAGTSSAAPDVTVTAPPPPTEQELAADSMDDFIMHHATVHFSSTVTDRNLARWRGGLQSICPLTSGLDPGYNDFVSARLRALATYVGAPVQTDLHCRSNVQILFTNKPKQSMEVVMKWATAPSFRNRYAGGAKHLIEYEGDRAIQGWYLVTRGGAEVLNTDMTLVGISVWPIWPQITQNYVGYDAIGSRVGGTSGSAIGIGSVIFVIDTSKVIGYAIGTIADYVSMLTLSVAQSPDHCDALPSILDLMSPSCGTRAKPTAVTAGDLAYLKALYYLNTGLDPSLSRSAIQDNMMRQFKLR
jgi:hypothetical protein